MKKVYVLIIIADCLLLVIGKPSVCFADSQTALASDNNADYDNGITLPDEEENGSDAGWIDRSWDNMELLTQEIIYYYDPEPLTADVYVRPGPFSSANYDFPLWRSLSSRNEDRKVMENVYINWNQEEYNKGIESGALEFEVSGSFHPVLLNESDEELWNQGLIRFEASSTPRMTVHVRPPDFVTVCIPDEPADFERTEKKGTPFADAMLPSDIKFQPVDSPYDSSIWLSVLWNQEQYDAGMASGSSSFTIDGTYSISDIMRGDYEEYKEYWDKGLIKISPEPKLTIQLYGRPSKPIVYYDIAAEATNIYHTAVRPESGFEEMIKPSSEVLNLRGGEWWDTRHFQIIWNEDEYRKGMDSGADSFDVSGVYGSGLLEDDEKEWWQDGLIAVESGLATRKLRVHVVRDQTIPFTVSFRSGCPLFVFPNPQGATKVICEFSVDGTVWYEDEFAGDYMDTFAEYVEAWMVLYDEKDEPIIVPQDKPSYYRMRITGSAYDGVTGILTLNDGVGTEPDDNGDIDGNRGGGGQGESKRLDGPSQAELDRMTGPGISINKDAAVQTTASLAANTETDTGSEPVKEQSDSGWTNETVPASNIDKIEIIDPEMEKQDKTELAPTLERKETDTQSAVPPPVHTPLALGKEEMERQLTTQEDSIKKPSSRLGVVMGLSIVLVLSSMPVFYLSSKRRSKSLKK